MQALEVVKCITDRMEGVVDVVRIQIRGHVPDHVLIPDRVPAVDVPDRIQTRATGAIPDLHLQKTSADQRSDQRVRHATKNATAITAVKAEETDRVPNKKASFEILSSSGELPVDRFVG